MPRYLVESYTADGDVEAACERAARAAALTQDVRYLRTTFLPEDETVLHLFDAPSRDQLERASREAELSFERIVDAIEESPQFEREDRR
jgi:hypothetical protein